MRAVSGSIVLLSGAILCGAAAMAERSVASLPAFGGVILIVIGLVTFTVGMTRPDGLKD
jgi:hypothetical protein